GSRTAKGEVGKTSPISEKEIERLRGCRRREKYAPPDTAATATVRLTTQPLPAQAPSFPLSRSFRRQASSRRLQTCRSRRGSYWWTRPPRACSPSRRNRNL